MGKISIWIEKLLFAWLGMVTLTLVDGHNRNVAIRFGMNLRIISLMVTLEYGISVYFLTVFYCLFNEYLFRSDVAQNFAWLRLWLTANVQNSCFVADVVLARCDILMN